MNLLETYVKNIIHEEKLIDAGYSCYRIIADTNCYGHEEYEKELFLSEYEYKSVKEFGYYMSQECD